LKPLSIRTLWAIWFAVVFVVPSLYAPLLWSARPEAARATAAAEHAPAPVTRAPMLLGALLRDAGDTARYFAYANAILGRPYDAFYVRPMEQWETAQARDSVRYVHVSVKPKRPLLPWRDFSVEYPPGMLIATLLPALATTNFEFYHMLFSLEMGLLLTFAVWINIISAEHLRSGAGRIVLSLSILFVAGLGAVCLRRYDAMVALAIAASILGLASNRPFAAGLSLAAGVIVKGVPIVFAPIGLFWFASERVPGAITRSFVGAAAPLVAVTAAFFILAGPHVFDAFSYHGQRPLQVESTFGALLIAARAIDPGIARLVDSFGSFNIASPWEPALRKAAAAFLLTALVGVYVWCWRAMRRAENRDARFQVLLAAVSAAIVAFVTLGKVFSAQYMVWLLPSGTLAAATGSKLNRKLLLYSCLLSQLEFPFVYSVLVGSLDPAFGFLVLIRNISLIAWAVVAMREAAQAARSPATQREARVGEPALARPR
jgi:Glycosyltransferase family 87